MEVVDREDQHAEDPVGAVDEGEALLGGQRQGLDASGGQDLAGRAHVPVGIGDLALADRGEAAVRERGQVAAGAERAVLRNDRRDARVQHRHQGLRDLGPGARVAHGQRAGAQQHRRAHHLALHGRTHAGCVRADQGALELLAPSRGDRRRRQRAEARRDSVDRFLRCGQPGDDLGAAGHRLARRGGQLDGCVVARERRRRPRPVGRCRSAQWWPSLNLSRSRSGYT